MSTTIVFFDSYWSFFDQYRKNNFWSYWFLTNQEPQTRLLVLEGNYPISFCKYSKTYPELCAYRPVSGRTSALYVCEL